MVGECDKEKLYDIASCLTVVVVLTIVSQLGLRQDVGACSPGSISSPFRTN